MEFEFARACDADNPHMERAAFDLGAFASIACQPPPPGILAKEEPHDDHHHHRL
jgi:hypothetical protein